MPQYIVPPSYRAGQGSRVASNVKDALSLMDFLVKLKQQDMAPKLADAQYYARQATEERAGARRDERLHKYGLEEIKEREKLQLAREGRQLDAQIAKEKRDEATVVAREKRTYGEGGYQASQDKLSLKKTLLSQYAADDVVTDKDGWASVKEGALTRTARASKEAEIFEMSGYKPKYSEEPNSEYQAMWSIYNKGATMAHPETNVVMLLESGKDGKTIKVPEVRYTSAGERKPGDTWGHDVDITPGVFTQGDIAAGIKDLASIIEKAGLPEEAASNMFHSGLTKNQEFMGTAKYQAYKSSALGMDVSKLGMSQTRLGMTRTQQLIDVGSSEVQKTKNTDALNYVKGEVFQSIYNQFFTTVENKVQTTDNMSNKLKTLRDKNPELAEAARTIFFQGDNYLNPGGPNTYETYDDFLAKFMLHDERGRGDTPSIAERAFKALGLTGEYKKVKGIIEGKDVKVGKKDSVEHTYVMDSANRMMEQGDRIPPFHKDILDRHFTNVDGSPTPFLRALDDAKDRKVLEYKYQGGVLNIIFDSEKNADGFRKKLKKNAPVQMQTFLSLLEAGLIDVTVK